MEFKAGDKVFIMLRGLQSLNDRFVKSYNENGYAEFIRLNTYLPNLAVIMINSNGRVINEAVEKKMCIPYFDDTSKSLSERINLFLEVYYV